MSRRLRKQKARGQIDFDHAIPFFQWHLERRLDQSNSGVVDQNPDGAKLLLHARHGRPDLRRVRDIGLNGDRSRAPRFQLRENFLVLLRVAAEDRQRRARIGKTERDAAPDPAIAAGDQRDATSSDQTVWIRASIRS